MVHNNRCRVGVLRQGSFDVLFAHPPRVTNLVTGDLTAPQPAHQPPLGMLHVVAADHGRSFRQGVGAPHDSGSSTGLSVAGRRGS